MIRIACTNCKTVLSIDDAFAGGVCRCQHCGTIQTVPAHVKDRAGVRVTGEQPVTGSKAIYHRGGKTTDPSDTSLDELAGVVASSGLSGSGLSSRRLTRPPSVGAVAGAAGGGRNMTMIFAGVGTVILVLVIVILWLVMRSSSSPAPTAEASGGAAGQSPAVTSGPNFCGIKLDAPSVIYVLDRGSGTKELFGGLKEAALKSAATLGSQRKFQVVFWNNGTDAAYPEASTTYATKQNVEAAQRGIDDVYAFGASDAKPAMQKAMARDPSAIVIATAKGYDLDDAWAAEMLAVRGSSAVKIHALDLGTGGQSVALKSLATKTGGQYRQVTAAELSAFAGH